MAHVSTQSPKATRSSVKRRLPIGHTEEDSPRPAIPPEMLAYLADSYPGNHNYRVVDGRLKPSCKLAVRLRKIAPLYPKHLKSLADLSSSKGFFVVSAALKPTCERSLGIDIFERDLEVSRCVKAHLGASRARFEYAELHDLAERIDEFGGPFQTVLLINMYQYLYFGSSRSPKCYLDHDRIFSLIRQVCNGRVIFSNRTEFARVQEYCQQVGREKGHVDRYSTHHIRNAASRFFDLTDHGRLGRYPLWTLETK